MPESQEQHAEEPAPSAGGSGSPVEEHLNQTLDPRSLRGLAHPLRIRLLRALRRQGPATASQLAERLGESSGATSYHLRQLAAHGFVVDDPTRGKGRERWWKSSHQGTTVDASIYLNPDPEVQGALDVYVHEIATIHTQELSTYLGDRSRWAAEWNGVADMSDFTLRLPPEKVRELDERMHALIESYRDVPEKDAPDAESVRIHLHAFPQQEG